MPMLKTIVLVPRYHFMSNLQLHHRAAVLLPHLDGDALQQKDCLRLPWWPGPGGDKVFLIALYSFIFFHKHADWSILFSGVSQPVWSQNQHSNPALLVHRVWHIHTGSRQINMILKKVNMMITLESKEDLQWQQREKKFEQLEHRAARCPEDHGPGRGTAHAYFSVKPNYGFICRTLTMSCNEALSWVKWRTSHRIWQRCPENTGLD